MSYNQPPPGYGYQPPQRGGPPQPPPGRRRKGHPVRTTLIVIGSLFTAILIIGAAASSGGGGPAPGAAGGPAAAGTTAAGPAATAPAPAAHTVTYVVTGSPADITYGPSGSSFAGTVPMRKTVPLGDPQFYAIDAQLQGDGTVTCQILVDGKTVSKATASGSYGIASCEISQDFSGNWQDTNSG